MATTIKLKNGSGAPTTGDLVQGEPAFDLTNKRLYTENASGTIIEVGTNPTSLTTGTFTSTGIDDNASSTAITIDSSQNTTFAGTITSGDITVTDATPFVRIQDSDVTNGYTQISNLNGNGYIGARNDSADGNLLIGGYGGNVFTEFARWSAAGHLTQENNLTVLGAFTSLGIDDNATSTAITISSAGATTFSGDVILEESTPRIQFQDSDITDSLFQLSMAGGTVFARSRGGTSSHGDVRFQRSNDGSTYLNVFRTTAGGDVIFYDDDGSTEGMRWDASTDRLGILDGTPASALQVGNGSTADSDAYVTFGKRVASTEDNLPFIGQDDPDGGGHNDLGIGVRSSNGTINFYTGNVAAFTAANRRMTIDNAGNVGINTTTPQAKLDISGSFSSQLLLRNTVGDSTAKGGTVSSAHYTNAEEPHLLIGGYSDGTNNETYVGGGFTSGNNSTIISFHTSANDTTTGSSERMRIDSSGNLLVGKTSAGYTIAGIELNGASDQFIIKSNSTPMTINRNTAGPNATITAFYLEDTLAGIISVTKGGTPAFAASSDIRLKDNVTAHESELSNVMSLRPVRWDWKDETKGAGEGFVAQELEQTAWADLVSDGEDGYKMVSGLGVVETRLIKALQEAVTRIETLEAEVAALKGE